MSEIINFAKKIFGTNNIKNIKYITPYFKYKYKLTVYVPIENTDMLLRELGKAGAGKIGNYTYCSFRTKGVGTFKGSSKSNPSIGKKNRLEYAEENRLEMICETDKLEKLTEIIYNFHPYEEPAFEIYPVLVRNKNSNKNNCYIELKKPLLLENIIKKINYKLDINILSGKFPAKKISDIIITTDKDQSLKISDFKKEALLIEKNKNQINLKII
jgi:hypothetical protein